jgi:hypothetical protein
MKRMLLLILGAAILLLNTMAIPTLANVDCGPCGTNCDGKMCKP